MERSLYDPAAGFYSRRTPGADFYTAPELHPAFADALTEELAIRLESIRDLRPTAPRFIVEMGSGDGTLARQILTRLKAAHPRIFDSLRYILIEKVESLLLDSILSLQDTGARLLGYTRLEDLQPLCGVFFSNELVDALPVHLVEKRGGRMREVYVESKEGCCRPLLGAFSSIELSRAAREIAPFLPEGGRHAVGLEAVAWMRTVSRALKVGSVITVDYGKRFPEGAPNPPRAFYRHTVDSDLTSRTGAQDLTASVDFNALIREGERAGLANASFRTLGRFLIDRGILSRLPLGGSPAAFTQRARVKTLFHPDGMGERFKILIQEKAAC